GKSRDVDRDHQPKRNLERQLARLVTKAALRDECAGPATQQFEKMQGAFLRSPAVGSCGGLVETVGNEGDQAYSCVNQRDERWNPAQVRGNGKREQGEDSEDLARQPWALKRRRSCGKLHLTDARRIQPSALVQRGFIRNQIAVIRS